MLNFLIRFWQTFWNGSDTSLTGRPEPVPDFVFLAHCIDVLSSLHVSFCIRTLAANPYVCHWFIWWLWPFVLFFLNMFWYWGQTFVADAYNLKQLKCMTWVIPRHGFQVLPYSSISVTCSFPLFNKKETLFIIQKLRSPSECLICSSFAVFLAFRLG